ncbi:ATP-binding protein [Saccharomonospora amisosensis]|uniref:ATP-binding protein n=1 Tax=Saccharomonospora amisosensis TaxID=1128677 RepID=UPI00141E1E7D|nr:ATP-binding protein [Saccharomonospora amisosensis]
MARRARARDLLDRSRVLLDRSRVAAAQFLANPRPVTAPVPLPASERPAIEAPPPAPAGGDSEQALIDICASIALRDLNLVDSLLSQLEEMESKEEDDQRLAQLYRLDHLATRLRRNAENLRVLAGRDASDMTSDTASLVDAVRAAMSSIDQYSRITIGRVVSLGVVGFAAEDLSRLLAELLDNAANQSPPNSLVRVSAHLTEQGSVLVRIEDEGIGLPPERLRELNERLSTAPVLDDDAVRHMGLAVVRRLAARHQMRVFLERRLPHGTTATVLLPGSLVAELPEASWSGTQTVVVSQPPPNGSTPRPAGAFQPAAAPGSSVLTEPPATTASGLPQRNAMSAPPREHEPTRLPKPRPVPSDGGTTPSGLPRRVSRSLKNPSGERGEAPARVEKEPDWPDPEGHEKLLADLDAFSDGEQTARAQRRDSGEADSSSEEEQ